MEAVVEAEPEATIKWYRDEAQLTPVEKIEIIYENNVCTLVISDVKPEDSGDYICEAENLVGKTTCKTTLTVNRELNFGLLFLNLLQSLSLISKSNTCINKIL